MASFKLCISEPSTGRTVQQEVKDNSAASFLGLNIGESIKGEAIGMNGYVLQITGGSDYCGFPMRRGILGQRKKIVMYQGVGFRGAGKGIKKRRTVCGHKIHERISQINLKVVQQGQKKITEIFGIAESEKEVKEQKSEEKMELKEEKKAKDKPKEKEKKLEEKTITVEH